MSLSPDTRARAIAVARVLWCIGLLIVVLKAAYTTVGVGRGRWDWLGSQWTAATVFIVCAAVIVARGLSTRLERAAWLVLASGMGFYALGTAVLAFVKFSPGFPTLSDVLTWALYPFALLAIWLLARAQHGRARADLWLDGVIGGLAVAAAGVVVVFQVVIDPLASVAGSPGNVVYVFGDLLILGFAIGCCGLLGWRPSPALVAVIVGFAALAVDDTLYMSAVVSGTFNPGGALDSYWLFAVLLIAAAAAWAPPVRRLDNRVTARSAVAFPFVFALIAVVLATYEALTPRHNTGAVVLTTLTLLAVVVRLALTVRAHLEMIDATERDAMTDALTGLGNRRKLLRDMDMMFEEASDERPVLFGIFDLDNLKTYNDTFGHPAGDALLVRLGEKLAHAVAPAGHAYRIGGDEFCVLLTGDAQSCRDGLASAAEALTDDRMSSIGNCCGSVLVPAEVRDTTEAMRCADRRLYVAKSQRFGTAESRGSAAQ